MRETPEAARAFEEYYDLGEDRTLLLLARKRLQEMITKNQDTTKKLPTTATILANIKKWSTEHKWQERIVVRDRAQAEKERKKRLKAIQAMNERHALIGTTQQAKSLEQIKVLMESKAFGSMAVVSLLKLALDTERIARGMPTEQVALTDKDGGAIEVIVETFWGRGTDPRKATSDDTPQEVQPDEEEPEISVEFGDNEE
jgi:hypothetical protein